MANASDFPAKGKIVEVLGSLVVFQPSGTTYSLHLESTGGKYAGPMNVPVEIIIRAKARKLWTVPSGGNFIAPIVGTPRTIQGWVRKIDQAAIVVQAGVPVLIDLPTIDSGVDLNDGAVRVGALINAMIMPGASFELAKAPQAAAV